MQQTLAHLHTGFLSRVRLLVMAVAAAGLVAACGSAQTATRGVSARQSFTFRKLSSVPLPVPTGAHESPAPLPGDVAYFSPNGMLFALTLNAANGTARTPCSVSNFHSPLMGNAEPSRARLYGAHGKPLVNGVKLGRKFGAEE